MASLPMITGGGNKIVFHYLGGYGYNLRYARNSADDAPMVSGYFTMTSGTYTATETAYTVQKSFKARILIRMQSRGDDISSSFVKINGTSVSSLESEMNLSANDVITINCGLRTSFSAISVVIEEI